MPGLMLFPICLMLSPAGIYWKLVSHISDKYQCDIVGYSSADVILRMTFHEQQQQKQQEDLRQLLQEGESGIQLNDSSQNAVSDQIPMADPFETTGSDVDQTGGHSNLSRDPHFVALKTATMEALLALGEKIEQLKAEVLGTALENGGDEE
ncbi:unnamed protein product [Lymnaea stagnalis]|uniref:Uncharacterized protein n=1 Tax=Lymnaea stagnalis TaxID=6523 RepID=A0AAV2I9J7_LYMST